MYVLLLAKTMKFVLGFIRGKPAVQTYIPCHAVCENGVAKYFHNLLIGERSELSCVADEDFVYIFIYTGRYVDS